MKNSLLVFSFTILCIAALHSQVPPAYQPAYNQMMKQQSFNNFQNSVMRMNYFGKGKLSDLKYFFKVKMKDSIVKEIKSFIFYDTSRKQTYIKHINKSVSKNDSNRNEKIYCNDIIEVKAATNSIAPLMQGIITDSCWLFKTLSGKINVYSTYPENNDNYSIAAIELVTGIIESFDPEKLKLIIAGNEKAMKKFNKKSYFSAIEKFNHAD
jgi:hypothetical protein